MVSRKKTRSHTEDENTDDIVYDDAEQGVSARVEKLKKELAICKKERKEYLDGWQRARADIINRTKRSQEEQAYILRHANQDFIRSLLPVLDSFDMAFGNGEAWEKVDKNWRMGVEHIHAQLLQALKGTGVEVINPEGEYFDPKVHNAGEMIETDDEEKDGMISEVVQKGYVLHDTIIRAPRVKVFAYKK